MDGNMLSGIEYPMLAGFGAIVGCLFIPVLALVGIWFPAVFAWLWLPPVIGTAAGLISAPFTK